MTRVARATLVLALLAGSWAHASEGPKLRFEIFLPGATAEQVEAEVVSVVEARLKNRPGISRIESSAVESQATVRVSFDQPPRCSEVDAITSIIEVGRPKRATLPVRYFDDLSCMQ